jgi:hypothetical protein
VLFAHTAKTALPCPALQPRATASVVSTETKTEDAVRLTDPTRCEAFMRASGLFDDHPELFGHSRVCTYQAISEERLYKFCGSMLQRWIDASRFRSESMVAFPRFCHVLAHLVRALRVVGTCRLAVIQFKSILNVSKPCNTGNDLQAKGVTCWSRARLVAES